MQKNKTERVRDLFQESSKYRIDMQVNVFAKLSEKNFPTDSFDHHLAAFAMSYYGLEVTPIMMDDWIDHNEVEMKSSDPMKRRNLQAKLLADALEVRWLEEHGFVNGSLQEPRTFVYVFQNCHGLTSVVNYDARNSKLNDFLSLFDAWNGHGERKLGIDKEESVWFECSKEFYTLVQTDTMRRAIEKFGVKLTTEIPFERY